MSGDEHTGQTQFCLILPLINPWEELDGPQNKSPIKRLLLLGDWTY